MTRERITAGAPRMKILDSLVDRRVQVAWERQVVHPLPDRHVVEPAVHPPARLELAVGDRDALGGRESLLGAQLAADGQEEAVPDDPEIPPVDGAVLQPGVHEDAHPLVVEDDADVRSVDQPQALAEGPGAIREQGLPGRVPAAEEDLQVHALDEVLLRREVPVEQRLRDAEPGRQVACVPLEPLLGEEPDRAVEDLPLPLRASEAAARPAPARLGTSSRHRPLSGQLATAGKKWSTDK